MLYSLRGVFQNNSVCIRVGVSCDRGLHGVHLCVALEERRRISQAHSGAIGDVIVL